MSITFNGKVAVVTGGASGIGLTTVEMLAASGAKVAIVDVSKENLANANERMKNKGTFPSYQLDITDVPAIAPTVSRIRKELGEIDILVCSAAAVAPRPAETIPEAEWDKILDTNTKGLFFCNQIVAIQSMIPRKSGVIINIASMFGLVASPPPMMAARYGTSKAGVVNITKQLAIEWARYNIRVNAVAPTFILTPMSRKDLEDPNFRESVLRLIPLHRYGTMEEIAGPICFLASDLASMITGITIPIDGGWTAQ